MDEEGFTVLGGQAETIAEGLESAVPRRPRPWAAVKLGAAGARRAGRQTPLGPTQLEVALLDRTKHRRAFVA